MKLSITEIIATLNHPKADNYIKHLPNTEVVSVVVAFNDEAVLNVKLINSPVEVEQQHGQLLFGLATNKHSRNPMKHFVVFELMCGAQTLREYVKHLYEHQQLYPAFVWMLTIVGTGLTCAVQENTIGLFITDAERVGIPIVGWERNGGGLVGLNHQVHVEYDEISKQLKTMFPKLFTDQIQKNPQLFKLPMTEDKFDYVRTVGGLFGNSIKCSKTWGMIDSKRLDSRNIVPGGQYHIVDAAKCEVLTTMVTVR